MNKDKQTAILGVAIDDGPWSNTRSLEEILFDLTQSALGDAGLDISDIEGLVVASNDQYDGRAISIMAASGSVGGVDRDILSTPSAGEHAFIMGAMRIASGAQQTQLVLAWSPNEAEALNEVQRLAADPYYHRRLPLDEYSSHALQANVLEHAASQTRDAAQAIARTIRANTTDKRSGAREPARWPLAAGVAAAPSSSAIAMVLSSPSFAKEHGKPAVWVDGAGWATEPSYLGDRDLAQTPSLRAATAQAYRAAGDRVLRETLAAAEIADATPHQALLALEGLGLSSRDQWLDDIGTGRFDAKGGIALNTSGGATIANPVFCAGLRSIASAAQRCRGANHRALAHAASGFAMQYNTVILMRGDQQ